MPEAKLDPRQFSEQTGPIIRDRGQVLEFKSKPPSRVYSANTASAEATVTYLRGAFPHIIEPETARESEMSDPTREEFDAKLATVEARTETRFVELSSKIDRLTDVTIT
jgi:hypothetical protein